MSSTLQLLPLAIWVPGPWELILILLVLLLFFGGKKLPELARSMGTSITQFKRGLKESNESIQRPESGGDDEEKK